MDPWAQYGVLGLVIAALGTAVRLLFLKYDEVQNLRIKEGREALEVIKLDTSAKERNIQVINGLADLIRAQKGIPHAPME